MNHFVALSILGIAIATVFSLITKEGPQEQIRYFGKLFAYMVMGSLAGAWVRSAIPW